MRILTISDSPTRFGGLARVHRHVLNGLMEAGHEVIPCGWFIYTSEQIKGIGEGQEPPKAFFKASNGADVEMYCLPKGGEASLRAAYDVISSLKPDLVLTIGDYWDFFYMKAIKAQMEYSFKWLAYLTIEEDKIPDKFAQLVQCADCVCVPSVYGYRSLRASGVDSHFIPYGTEEAFFRLGGSERDALRAKMGVKGVRFIMVGQNTWRKNIPAVMMAVRTIKSKFNPRDLSVYVHTNTSASDPMEAYQYDLYEVAEKLGVSDIMSFPSDQCSLFSAPDDTVMAEHYNASDYFVSAAASEGYGLPMVEAMACGVPAVANSNTSVTEHIGGKIPANNFIVGARGVHVSPRMQVCPPARLASICNEDAMANAMCAVYKVHHDQKEAGRLAEMRQKCVEYGKGRTWAAMKDLMNGCVASLPGTVSIPVEVI